MKRRTKSKTKDGDVVALPRADVDDAALVEAIIEKDGVPSDVADAFDMSMADLLMRAKVSTRVAEAFAEARQRHSDKLRKVALSVAIGSPRSNVPPDPMMLRWYIERYG